MPRLSLIVLGAAVIAVLALAALGVSAATARLNEAPQQPIAFDHSLHVSELGMACAFCHRNAAQGVAAGVPAVEQCMFCHVVVGAGKSEVEKVRSAWARQEPVQWRRVYRLADIVRFTHEPHIRAQVDCSACHGPVEKMKQVRQAAPLGMAQCMACHRQKEAPTDCAFCHY